MKLSFNLLKPLILSSIVLGTTSCKRNIDEDVELDVDTSIMVVDAQVEVSMADIDNIADQAEVFTSVTKKTEDILSCVTLTKDTIFGSSHDTVNIVVDFGNTNCEGIDGHNRRGIIKVTSLLEKITGFKKERKIETVDYYMNDIKIECGRKLVYAGQNSSNQYFWTLSAASKIFYSSTDSATHSSERTYTFTSGILTPFDISDDKWTIEGNGQGIRKDGNNYTVLITEPLLKAGDCIYIQEGKIKYTVDNARDFTIDYGAGSGCDNKVDLIYDGGTKVITID